MSAAIQCQQCGSAMEKTTKADKSGCTGWLLGFMTRVTIRTIAAYPASPMRPGCDHGNTVSAP